MENLWVRGYVTHVMWITPSSTRLFLRISLTVKNLEPDITQSDDSLWITPPPCGQHRPGLWIPSGDNLPVDNSGPVENHLSTGLCRASHGLRTGETRDVSSVTGCQVVLLDRREIKSPLHWRDGMCSEQRFYLSPLSKTFDTTKSVLKGGGHFIAPYTRAWRPSVGLKY